MASSVFSAVILTGVGLASIALTAASAGAADMAAKGAAPAAPERCKVAISTPAFGGIIKQNPDPACMMIDGFGEVYFGGALSGYGFTQTNQFPRPTEISRLPSDEKSRIDLSNAMIWIQKADGPVQFFVQGGAYSIPTLGLPIFGTADQTKLLFGVLPVAYGKVVFNDAWSIQAGRMPTLIGSEAPFTFQNINIQRGLLFNQENIINHGVQLNYSEGPVSVSVAGTDGFFSGTISWLTGAATYKLDDNNTIGVNGGYNAGRTNVLNQSPRFQYTTPQLTQNSSIVSVNYTYTNGPLTITPYIQYTSVERDLKLNITRGTNTYGAAVLASYAFTDNFALAGRVEYIEQSGKPRSGTTSLLYGPGSAAWSFTITPTYTVDRFFLRGEYSRVELANITRGDITTGGLGTGFGRSGNKSEQDRYMLETGFTF